MFVQTNKEKDNTLVVDGSLLGVHIHNASGYALVFNWERVATKDGSIVRVNIAKEGEGKL